METRTLTTNTLLTFVLLEVQRVGLVGDHLLQVDDVLVAQLPQDLDLPDGRDGEAFPLVVRPHHLQGDDVVAEGVPGFEDLAKRALPDLGDDLEGVDAALPPVAGM